MLRALRHKNYRNYLLSQVVSFIGLFIQGIAIAWLVYRLSGSVFLLGLVGFLAKIPNFFIAPIAGVYVDRVSPQKLILGTQILFMLLSGTLTFLTLSGYVQIWHILIIIVVSGVLNSIYLPARQAFILELIEGKEDLSNAIALNATVYNGAVLLGPAIGGLIINFSSEGICFMVNTISYIPIILVLSFMSITKKFEKPAEFHIFKKFKEGCQYTFGQQPIRTILLLLMVVSLFGMPYEVVMPVFAKEILKGGPNTLGFLWGAVGAGSLVGALFLAKRKSMLNLELWNVRASAILGFGAISFALSRQFPLSLLTLFFVGFGAMVLFVASNSILQTISEESMRGRVMSFYVVAIAGISPLGNLLTGWIANKIGSPLTVFLGGVACLSGAFYFFLQLPEFQKNLSGIYSKLGFISEKKVQSVKTDHII